MAELTATPYRVVAPMVGCRAPNSLGLPGARGGLVAVQVDQGSMLPIGAPPEDVARLVFKGMVEPVDGDIDDQVAAELERIKAAHYRPPAPPLTPAQRLSYFSR